MAQSKRYFTFPLTLELIFPEGDSDELKDMLLRDNFAFFELIVEKLPMLESTIKQIGGLDDVEILSISQTEQHIIEVVFCIKDVETLNNFYEVANKENDNRPNKLSRYISAFAAKHMEFANFRMYMPVDLYQTGRERLTARYKTDYIASVDTGRKDRKMAQSKRYFTFPLTLELIFPEGDSDELKDMLLRDNFAFFELIVEKLPMLESTIKQIGGLDDVEILSISQTEQHIIEVVFCIKDVETLNNFYEVANKENDNRPNKLSRYISAFAAKHMEFANFRMYMPVDLYQTGRERLTARMYMPVYLYKTGRERLTPRKKRSILKKIVLPVVFGIGAMVAAPLVLSGIGFTSAGIAAGTIAAKMMSVAAVANGGGVAAGGIVAVLQSAGAVGISAGATAGIGAAAAGTTAVVQEIVTDKEKCDKKRH